MKGCILCLTLLLNSTHFFSQELHLESVFTVVSTGKIHTEESLKSALVTADWCGMINPETNYTITFSDGAKVEINNAKTLSDIGVSIDITCVRNEDMNDDALYEISQNGSIIRLVSKDKNIKSSANN